VTPPKGPDKSEKGRPVRRESVSDLVEHRLSHSERGRPISGSRGGPDRHKAGHDTGVDPNPDLASKGESEGYQHEVTDDEGNAIALHITRAIKWAFPVRRELRKTKKHFRVEDMKDTEHDQ
jgi:hypothetical protein